MSVTGPSQTQPCFSQLIQDEIYLDGRRIKNDDNNLYIDTGTGNILPEEMSNFYSLNFPNLSAVSASECNIQSFTTISSGIAPEAELSIAEDKGVNTSTRDLVLTAITVMKGRKARPDTKRICNWVNRKYGRSVQEVVQEIDDLCQQAILEKVDYKGSISFRITSEKKLHKRVGRRKNTPQGTPETVQTVEDPFLKIPRTQSPKKSSKSPSKSRGEVEKMDPVTLNLLLREEMNVMTDGQVTKDNIVKALELTSRPINKRAVYRDLETILAHEIHLGYLVKHADNFIVACINKDKHYRGTIPLKSSKRKPKPTQKYLEMEAELKHKTEKYADYISFDPEGNFPLFGKTVLNNTGKSEEDLKDELIKEKLITSNLLKMKSKMKSSRGKNKKENSSPPAATIQVLPVVEQKKATPTLDANTTVTLQQTKKTVLVPVKPKIKKETWQVSITVKEAKPRMLVSAEPTKVETQTQGSLGLHKQINDEIKMGDHVEPRGDLKAQVKEEVEEELKDVENEWKESAEEEEEIKEEEEICDGGDLSLEEMKDTKSKRCARKRRNYTDESDEEEDATGQTASQPELATRTSSGRKKRARKIFDPADHDVPSRIIKKCRTNSPSSTSPTPDRPAPIVRSGSIDRKSSENMRLSTDLDTVAKSSQDLPLSRRRHAAAVPVEPEQMDRCVDPLPGDNHAGVLRRSTSRRRSTDVEKCQPGKDQPQETLDRGTRLNNRDVAEVKIQSTHKDEAGPKKRVVQNSGSMSRRNSDPTPACRMEAKVMVKRKSLAEKELIKKTLSPTPGKNDKKISNNFVVKSEKSNSSPNGKLEKNLGPKKIVTTVIKSSAPTTVSKPRRENKKDVSESEGLKNSPLSENNLDSRSDDEEKLRKKVETDPLFKVPAPKKPLGKSATPEKQSLKNGALKNKNSKQVKGKPNLAKMTAIKTTKTCGPSTRASTLSVSLRTKKENKEKTVCMACNGGNKKNEKLIFCKDCDKILHPSCLNYPEDLTDRIYKQSWQCIDCKTCFICAKSGNDDKLLFCDSCDLGYHMSCHRPSISRKPRGRWECDSCAAETGYRGETDEKFSPPGAATYFEELLPAMPAGVGPWPALGYSGQFCPAPDQYPPHWQDLPLDESLPDISGWSPARMSQYLVQNGIKETAAKVFFDQEIDGASALVLQRRDVLQGLGLKLGPALKIYHHIKRLQTRRNFGLVA